jgi:hypothetical protein
MYILIGISTLLSILFYTGTVTESVLINWCYLLLIISIIAAIVFPVLNLLSHPASARKSLIGLLFLGIVTAISYAFAGDEVLKSYEPFGVTPSESKWVGTGLIMFYLLSIVAIGATFYSGLTKLLK